MNYPRIISKGTLRNMNKEEKVTRLDRLIASAQSLTASDCSDAAFVSWRDSVIRTLVAVFGEDSHEYKQFSSLEFYYNPAFSYLDTDYSRQHRQCFARDMTVAISHLRNCRAEIQEFTMESLDVDQLPQTRRVFISHSVKDAAIAELTVELLEDIGLHERVFCSSTTGTGADLGENFLDRIKAELTADTLVLFLLSQNFNSSSYCLMEMGAVWVLAKDHIPMAIPPFEFESMNLAFRTTVGLTINKAESLTQLREYLVKKIPVENPIPNTTWERKKKKFLSNIEPLLPHF